ncbi:MAG: hypothetical protein E7256_06660 [Lachnospiraceae bacterium]|nr:hypothetical protein [Lachnospiraceae bacterium]
MILTSNCTIEQQKNSTNEQTCESVDYIIFTLPADNLQNEKFTYVVLFSLRTTMSCIEEIVKSFRDKGVHIDFVLDQLLHTGENPGRFLHVQIDSLGKLDIQSVTIPKRHLCRKVTCGLLKNTSVLEYSGLTNIEKRMINKGIVI